MQATIIVTATTKAGNLSRLMLALKRQSYKISSNSLSKSRETGLDTITLSFDSEDWFSKESLETLIRKVPTVIDIDVHINSAASLIGNERKSDSQVDSMVVSVTAPRKLATITSKSFSAESSRLITAYPNIHNAIVTLKSTYADAEQLTRLLQVTGNNVGLHAANQVELNQESGVVNKTVQSSLMMNKSQFGGMPVIADLMNVGTRNKKPRSANPLQSAQEEFSQFLTVTLTGNAYEVTNCPECGGAQEAECHFMISMFNGFFQGYKSKYNLVAKQVFGSSSGPDVCRFEVFKA